MLFGSCAVDCDDDDEMLVACQSHRLTRKSGMPVTPNRKCSWLLSHQGFDHLESLQRVMTNSAPILFFGVHMKRMKMLMGSNIDHGGSGDDMMHSQFLQCLGA